MNNSHGTHSFFFLHNWLYEGIQPVTIQKTCYCETMMDVDGGREGRGG